jgi:predicted lipid-binding transport protein (Tim44 family)
MAKAFSRVPAPEESLEMPVTKSELLYFCAGAVVGALGAKNYEKLKTQFGPILAKAGEAAADAYADVARRVAEQVESVQDAMAEAKATAEANGAATNATHPTASTDTPIPSEPRPKPVPTPM